MPCGGTQCDNIPLGLGEEVMVWLWLAVAVDVAVAVAVGETSSARTTLRPSSPMSTNSSIA